jgi:hypothetical protein
MSLSGHVLTNYVAPGPKGSPPRSQDPATSPYPEPIESTPCPKASLPKILSDLILPSTPRSKEQSLSFGLSHQSLLHFSLFSYAYHMPCPSHSP